MKDKPNQGLPRNRGCGGSPYMLASNEFTQDDGMHHGKFRQDQDHFATVFNWSFLASGQSSHFCF
jgi:hypothetical protein